MWKNGSKGVRAAAVLSALAAAAGSTQCAGAADCDAARSGVERLVCGDPALSQLDRAVAEAFREDQDGAKSRAPRDTQLAQQRAWLAARELACPSAIPSPGLPLQGPARELAVGCLSRIYEQRLAVLRYQHNTAAWPVIPFHPTLAEGAGTRLCEDLERDLRASFLGPAPNLDPLGERAIGFTPQPALGEHPMVLRADIDAYNRGKPSPVLRWVAGNAGFQTATVEYRAFDTSAALLAAIGRGGEPLAKSVYRASRPLIEFDRLSRIGERRFFRYNARIYLLAPVQPVPGKPGDLGVYRLYGPKRLHRLCLFDAHGQTTGMPALREVAALEQAVGPLLPAGRLCAAAGEASRTLRDNALWRPWVLEQGRGSGEADGGRLALYMRNRALTGPESARQYRAYLAAKGAAIEAMAPYYRTQFGRTAAEAKRLAALYLDRLVSDGTRLDPDDEAIAALFALDFAEKHAPQRAALTGDMAALREALGPEPKAVAKGVKGKLDEPLITDALEHPAMLRELLETGFDADETGASGRTPLMVAARLDLVEAAGILLAHGASPDLGASDAVAQSDSAGDALCPGEQASAADTPGRTALSYAAEFASPELVRLLLDHGARADKPDSAGRRPADYAKRRKGDPAHSGKIIEMLNRASAG